jgi:hypothetical protein
VTFLMAITTDASLPSIDETADPIDAGRTE